MSTNQWEAEEELICECGAAGSGELHLEWCEANKFNVLLKGEPESMTNAQIKHMVDRFLAWKLPKTFCPDGGITFDPIYNKGTPHEARHEPTGTNVLTATEAYVMVRHMIEGLPS
jgi:hypothetical protein